MNLTWTVFENKGSHLVLIFCSKIFDARDLVSKVAFTFCIAHFNTYTFCLKEVKVSAHLPSCSLILECQPLYCSTLFYSMHYIFKNHWQHIQNITAEHDYIWCYIADDIGQIVLFLWQPDWHEIESSIYCFRDFTVFHQAWEQHLDSFWSDWNTLLIGIIKTTVLNQLFPYYYKRTAVKSSVIIVLQHCSIVLGCCKGKGANKSTKNKTICTTMPFNPNQ